MADDDRPNIVQLQTKQDPIAAAGDHVRRNYDALCENAKLIAKLRRIAYLAYVAEGFNEQQALELCYR